MWCFNIVMFVCRCVFYILLWPNMDNMIHKIFKSVCIFQFRTSTMNYYGFGVSHSEVNHLSLFSNWDTCSYSLCLRMNFTGAEYKSSIFSGGGWMAQWEMQEMRRQNRLREWGYCILYMQVTFNHKFLGGTLQGKPICHSLHICI